MTTTKLKIPEMTASQSQKHVTFNEALFTLDNLVQLSVLDKDLTAAPVSPTTGDTYIVGNSATGSWLGKDAQVASYDGDGWIFFPPNDGWFCWVNDEAEIYFYNGGWSALSTGYLPISGGTLTGDLTFEKFAASIHMGTGNKPGPHGFYFYDDDGSKGAQLLYRSNPDVLSVEDGAGGAIVEFPKNVANGIDSFADWNFNSNYLTGISRIGIGGATPDATNTFAFYGTNLLLNSGGSIDMTYNKNATVNDASMTFQTGFSTKALLGLLGDDDFTIKVGGSFTTALSIDEATGTVAMPEGFSTGTGFLGGHAIAITGERNAALVAGQLMAMGNGAVASAGAVMPQTGKVVAMGVAISSGASGNNVFSVAVNKVVNTFYQVSLNYSGSGTETAYSDFSSSPLTFSAGDSLNVSVSIGVSSITTTTLYVIFD